MNDIDDLLHSALHDLGEHAPHDQHLAGIIRRRSRWRRAVLVAPVTAGLAVIAVVLAVTLIRPAGQPGAASSGGSASTGASAATGPSASTGASAATGPSASTGASASSTASVSTGRAATNACVPLKSALLPTWARTGFTDPEPSAPFVTSASGAMVGIVFASPLVSPTVPDRGNKILWVTNDAASAGDTLTITGTVEGGSQTMHTTVDGGPGPSTIDVPTAGCWHFELSWGTHRDSVNLQYVAP